MTHKHRTSGLVELANVLSLVRNGLSIKQSKTDGGLPITRIETISDGAINPERVGFAGVAPGEKDHWLMQENDILISHINSEEHLGKCAIYEGRPRHLVHGMNLLNLRADTSRIIPRYLLHTLRTNLFRRQIARVANRSVNQASVSITSLKTLKIPLPYADDPARSLREQKRIADILDKADAIRRKRQEAFATFGSLLQSAFIEFFGNPLTNPRGWHTETLGTVVATDRHGLKRGPFGGALKKEIFVPSGYKVYEQKHAIANDFTIGSYYVDESKFLEMEAFAIKPGDLIVSCSGTMGRVAIVPDDAEPGIINQALLRITPDTSKVSADYLKLLLETEHVQQHLYGFSRGSGLKNFPPMSEVRALPVPVPSAETLESFRLYLAHMRLVEQKVHNQVHDTEDLFKSLVQCAFRGELREARKGL